MRKILSRIKNKIFNKTQTTIQVEPKSGKDILSDRLSVFLNLGFPHEKEAFDAIQIVKYNTMLPYEPIVSLYSQVAWIEESGIQGSFVECGVWKGGASGMMALANLKFSNTRRQIHLFDAFDDICQPKEGLDEQGLINEVVQLSGELPTSDKLEPLKGIYDQFGGAGSLEINKELMEDKISYPKEFVHYHKGWFQDTVPADHSQLGEIAILRLDGDWYESTKVCMDHLYPLVVKGGLVIIDDYGYNEGCRRAVHEVLAQHDHHPYINYVNQTCRYFFKP